MQPDLRQLAAFTQLQGQQEKAIRFMLRAQLAGQLMASFLTCSDALAAMDKEEASYEEGRESACEMIVDITDRLLHQLDKTATRPREGTR